MKNLLKLKLNQKYLEGIKIVEKKLKKDPENIILLNELAFFLYHFASKVKNKNQKTARIFLNKTKRIYKKVLKKEPSNPQALLGLAKVLALESFFGKKLSKKEKIFLKSLIKKISFSRKIPPLIKTTNLGDIYFTLKNFPLAERYFKKALSFSKKKEEKMISYVNLLIFYLEKRNFQKAFQVLKKIKKIKPTTSKQKFIFSHLRKELRKKFYETFIQN